jgi:hypothetical protein
MYLWYPKKKGVNVANPRHKNTVSESVLCRQDREMLAKSANIRLSGQHVANMLPTFLAKLRNNNRQLLSPTTMTNNPGMEQPTLLQVIRLPLFTKELR